MIADEFLSEIEDFLTRSGMRHTTFGTKTMNDPSFVMRLREKKNPTTRTIQKVKEWMEENQHLLKMSA